MKESLVKYTLLKKVIENLSGRRVIIWGTGTIGRRVAKVLRELNIKIDFYVDADIGKHGSSIEGIRILAPEYLKDQKQNFYVMVAMNDYAKVYKQLIEYGYHEQSDFHGFGIFARIEVDPVDYRDEFHNSIVGCPKSLSSKVIFAGKNNKLVFGPGVVLDEATIVFHANDGYCYIGNDSQFNGTIFVGLGCRVMIGKRLSVTKNCFISTGEFVEAKIGDDCMFASNIEIRCDDGHPIFDVVTSERVNISKSITIGNHVWLAFSAVLLSGSEIGNGSVIGHSSVLKSKIPNNCIAVGIPARVVKKNIAWDNVHLLINQPHHFSNGDYIEDRDYWNTTRDD